VSAKPTCHDQAINTENGTVRWIALDGAANARAVVTGVLLRSDNLQSLTARDVRLLVEQEMLEVVLDLRTDVEASLALSAVGRQHGSRCGLWQPLATHRAERLAG